MNKKVLASIISLSAVGVLGVGIVCANADKSLCLIFLKQLKTERQCFQLKISGYKRTS